MKVELRRHSVDLVPCGVWQACFSARVDAKAEGSAVVADAAAGHAVESALHKLERHLVDWPLDFHVFPERARHLCALTTSGCPR